MITPISLPTSNMIPDFLILNLMMSYLQSCCVTAMQNLHLYANRLLYLLAGIDLILAVLFNLEDADHMKTLIVKTVKYGFFIYLVTHYADLLNILIQGFQFFGKVAGKNLPLSNPITDLIITNPSAIGTYGIYLIKNIILELSKYDGIQTILAPAVLFKMGIAFLIAGSYFLIGIQVFVLIIEFYMVGALSMILIPFGVNRYTSFLSQGVLRALFTIGVKLMVMMFIIAMVVPILIILTLPSNADINTCLFMLLGSLAISYLALHAPNLAMTIMSGTPMMSASGLAGVGSTASQVPGKVKELLGKTGATAAAATATNESVEGGAALGIGGAALATYNLGTITGKENNYPKVNVPGVDARLANGKNTA